MTTSDTARPGELGDTAPDAIVPDYSRVGFRGLQALCKERQIPADGTGPQLIEKLRAWDAEHGRTVDLTLPEGADDDPLGDDPLADDLLVDDTPTSASAEPARADTPFPAPHVPTPPTAHTLAAPARPTSEAPTGGGEAASAPPPDGHLTAGNLPSAADGRGRPILDVREGLVRVGEGHQGREVRGFRAEYVIGPHEVTDEDHFRFIADTHVAAHAAGHETKGGIGIGQRVGYAQDADGRRTVIYQVPLRRSR